MDASEHHSAYVKAQGQVVEYEDGLHPVELESEAPEVVLHEAPKYSIVEHAKVRRNSKGAPELVNSDFLATGTLPTNAYQDDKKSLHIRGLRLSRRRVAWIAIICIVVVVATLSGGLGAGIPHASKSHSSSTAASSTASSTVTLPPVTTGFTGLAEVKCPSINNTQFISTTNPTNTSKGTKATFSVLCAVHWPTGSPAANNNGTVQQVGSQFLVAYTLEQCLDHCTEYNAELIAEGHDPVDLNENGSGCLAVTYNANLTQAFANHQQNCFLKDRVGIWDSAKSWTESAVLTDWEP